MVLYTEIAEASPFLAWVWQGAERPYMFLRVLPEVLAGEKLP
jgi:hypothetical protein